MEAVEYRQVDEAYKMHQLAYLTFIAQAKTKKGKYGEKPVYNTFKKFYDYEKELKKVKQRRENNCFTGVGEIIKKQQKGG